MNSLEERLQNTLGSTYHIECELGGGGMSRVFVASEVELGRKVVVKVLPPEMAAGVNADRFRREIQLAASLQHPHIVPLLRAGREGDLVWYTMPLVDGESLRAKLAREGELAIPDVVRILRDISSALAYAHMRGVVHRDIKPDNILLTHRYAVVTDFGVAKALSEATGESHLTSVGVVLGTPTYMAPEQAAADPHTDHRADIYALGVLGYEMVAGVPPFSSPSPQMVLAAQVTQQPTPVTHHRAAVPPVLASVIMRCLEKKPADRYQTATELVHQLEGMSIPSGGMAPTTSLPVAASVSSGKRVRTRVAVVAVAALLAGGVGAAVVAKRTRAGVAADATARPMLVVLPFENLGQPGDQYFADGITEEITSRLASLGGLGVISRTSAIQYKNTTKPVRQIGQELNVAYVLEGTIRWQKLPDGSSRVRVNPQLVNVADDTHLWVQTYDADLKEVFTVQSDIAGRVARALNVALRPGASGERPLTDNVEAYQHYLRGGDYANRSATAANVFAAIDSYERAVALDPQFAGAHARLARRHAQAYWFYHDRTPQRIEAARRAAERALELDRGLADAHVAAAFVHYWGSRDYDAALRAFREAQRLAPSNADAVSGAAFILRRQGKWKEALQQLEHAAALDPRSRTILAELAVTHKLLHRYDDAARWYERVLTIAPDEAPATMRLAEIRAVQAGDLGAAHVVVNQALTRTRGRFLQDAMAAFGYGYSWDARLAGATFNRALVAAPITSGVDTVFYHYMKADALLALGRATEARAHFDSARVMFESRVRQRPDDTWYRSVLAIVYARLGRSEDAVRSAREAAEMMPVERDAVDGSDHLVFLAETYTIVGRHDEAVQLLERLVRMQSRLDVPRLRLEPRWQPLRAHPGFQRLIAG